MRLSDHSYTLEAHSSGKTTCKIATLDNGLKYFIKYPRTVEQVNSAVEEIFAELLGEKVISELGVLDIGSDIEFVELKPAIVQQYHEKNWSNLNEELEIGNYHEWPLYLAAETWMRQSDRSPGKPEHVGLAAIEGVGVKYRAIPLDLGHAFIGQPSGYQGLDEDLTAEFPKTLFWTNREFSLAELEASIAQVENLPVVKIISDVSQRIISQINLSTNERDHLDRHADKVAHFLLVRRVKLRGTLVAWWNQNHNTATPTANVAPVPQVPVG